MTSYSSRIVIHIITGASQTLAGLCGYRDRADLIGLSDYEIFPESYADRYYLLEQRCLLVCRWLARSRNPSPGRRWRVVGLDHEYPIFGASGAIVGLYGIARDVTGQHKLDPIFCSGADFVSQDHGERFLDVLTEFAATLFEVDYVHGRLA